MRRALELARRGRGRVHPNPMVGAVVVRDGAVAGEGYHREYGAAHAEVEALAAAGGAARGATLYVSLEPCAHHGKTPPCTDAILAAGIRRLVYAAADPDARAAGGGRRLHEAGLEVVPGVERDAARALNAQFFHLREHGSPWISLKLALSLDGGIAAAPGRRTQLTGRDAVTEAHRLRADCEAVMVGIGTVLADDPLLTVRGAPCRVPPIRIVVDAQARLPLSSRLIATRDAAPVWLICSDSAPAARRRSLEDAGVHVLTAAAGRAGLDPVAVRARLASAGVRSVLLEGGAALAGSFLAAAAVDRLNLFVAPRFLGAGALRGLEPAGASDWRFVGVERFGTDVLLTLDPAVPGESS